MAAAGSQQALVVEGLSVHAVGFEADIVGDISFAVAQGETLGVVGESGSGKTTVALALLGFTRPGTQITKGSVSLDGVDLLRLPEQELRRRRGRLISFVPQDPSTGLSPGMRIGRQVSEMVAAHFPHEGAVVDRTRRAFEHAQLPNDDGFLRRYPHQLSGGQQQRVAIAMALACEPKVVVMDEPTTGLDVTTQARLLETIKALLSEQAVAVVYVSHDLGVIRNLADRVAVMYGGRILEVAPVDELFGDPRQPYTRRLLEAVPRVNGATARPRGIAGSAVEPWNRPPGCPFAPRCSLKTARCDAEMPPVELDHARLVRCWNWSASENGRVDPDDLLHAGLAPADGSGRLALLAASEPSLQPMLEILDLSASYQTKASVLISGHRERDFAIEGIRFAVVRGSCVALVGESGSGKTTLLRTICGLHAPDSGEVKLLGVTLASTTRRRESELRRRIQLVPQNPDSSLNPRHRVGAIVGRPLRLFFGVSGKRQRLQVGELLERVQLRAAMASRYPRELSGGEKQRVAIARALAAAPDVLLCDEITAALDVAVQAGVLNLVQELRDASGMTVLFVSHDLAVVKAISDEVIVMRHGTIREQAPVEALFSAPADSYTRELLAAIPPFRAADYPAMEHALSR